MDRILTETDSPYLAPHPLRGTVNNPSNVGIICDALAQIKGVTIDKMAETVYQNTKTLFKKII
jgi:TatD DNase family protein